MIPIHFPSSEAKHLDTEFHSPDNRTFRDRLPIVRMAHRGRARPDIAADLSIHRKTVSRWLKAYCDQGLDGLRPKTPPGKSPTIPPSLADSIRPWVIDGPTKQGLDRANWTHQELTDHLYKTHGIRNSRSAVQRFGSKIGIRLYRRPYRYLRGDPNQQARAKQDLAGLAKKPSPGNSSC